jgi:hypothetical protein
VLQVNTILIVLALRSVNIERSVVPVGSFACPSPTWFHPFNLLVSAISSSSSHFVDLDEARRTRSIACSHNRVIEQASDGKMPLHETM